MNFKASPTQRRKQAWIVLIWTTLLYSGYQFTNHVHFFELHTLPMFDFEKSIPFLLWTVIPYYLLVGGMYLPIFLRNQENFYRALLALTITVLVNYTVFMFFPTTYPRPPTPETGGISLWFYNRLIEMDTPANCLPSGHISVSAIGFYYLLKENYRWRVAIVVCFVLLASTVLTTKQHYFVDVLAGLSTAIMGMLIARIFVRK